MMDYNDKVDHIGKLKNAFNEAYDTGDEEVALSLLKEIETMEATLPKGDASRVQGTDIGINAVTGGLGEALPNMAIAGIEALRGNGGYVENYRNLRDKRQADVAAYWKENPVKSAIYSGVGTLYGGIKLSQAGRAVGTKALPKAAQYLTKKGALPALARYGAAIGEGAALGGYTASGMGEDIGEGVATGAVATAAIYPLINLAVWAKNNYSTAGKVNKTIDEMARRSGKTKTQITQEMREAHRLGKTEYTMADALGTETGGKELFKQTAVQSPKANEARRVLEQRNIGQSRRLAADVNYASGGRGTARQIKKLETAIRSTEGRLNFNAAKYAADAKGVDISGPLKYLDDTMSAGTGYQSLEAKQAEAWAKKLNATFGKPVATPVNDFKTLHQMKKELDRLTDIEFGPRSKGLGPFYKGLRNQVDDALEKSSGEYRKARDTWRIQSNALDALKRGQQMKGARTEDILDAFGAEKGVAASRNFGVGLTDDIIKSMQTGSPDRGASQKLLADKWQDVMPTVYGKQSNLGNRGQRLVKQLLLDDQMRQTGNEVLSGSQTAYRLLDATNGQGMIVDAMTGNKYGVMRRLFSEALDYASGNNQAVRDKLIEFLMNSDPKEALKAFQKAELAGQIARGSSAKFSKVYSMGQAWLKALSEKEATP